MATRRPSTPRPRAFALLVLVAAAVACSNDPDPTAVFDTVHGTRPVQLDKADVGRIARAFGIEGEPERIEDGPTGSGWEAEDDLRALYLTRTPSAWYAQVTDGSVLTHAEGDRAQICAAADAPSGCSDPGVRFVVDVGLDAPSADEAVATARAVLDDAGLTDDRWAAITSGPSREPVPCGELPPAPLDCSRQLVPTRGVTLMLEIGKGRTPVRWGVVVGPGGQVLSATGRIAVARDSPPQTP
jgi:hypothetical protein